MNVHVQKHSNLPLPAIGIALLLVVLLTWHFSTEVNALRGKLEVAESSLRRFEMISRQLPQQLTFTKDSIPSQIAVPIAEDEGGITTRDRELSLAMNARRKKGEFILKFERPVDRKMMESHIKAQAATVVSNRAPDLAKVFDSLGISSETSKQLQLHQEKIALASLETETSMQQLLLARQGYDQRLRDLLTPEAYNSYKQYEDSLPASAEFGRLITFADKNGAFLDPAYKDQAITLLQGSRAYTINNWSGPYDGWPEIAVGKDMAISEIQYQIDQIQQFLGPLLQKTADAHLPDTYISTISSYYIDAIHAREQTIAYITGQASQPGVLKNNN